ncbi:MAG: MASE1 domain-containing protein [Xenococcaceae cyanobacterium]
MALSLTDSWRYYFKVAVVAIACFSNAWLTISLMGLGAEASAVWPPAGIALAALLLWGERVWPGIFLGDFLLMQMLGAPWELALSSALGSTASAIVAVKLLRRFGFSPSLERLRDVLALVLLAAIFSSIVNATVDIAAQFLAGRLEWSNFWQNWWILWLGDSTGILVITPLLLRVKLASQALFRIRKRPPKRLVEAGICLSLLGCVSWVVFAYKGMAAITQYPLEYLPFPFVVWAALRFRFWGAIMSSPIVSGMAIWGVLEEGGPFVVKAPDLNQAILLLQTFMGVVTITALVLSAVMSEREQAEDQLRDTLDRDRLLAELAGVALRIRQSLDLEQIFNTTVAEIRSLLQADRVYIRYLYDNEQAKIVAESVDPCYQSLLGWSPDDQLLQEIQTLFAHTNVLVADDTTQLENSPALREYYLRNQVRATLVVPLMVNKQLLGVLVAHQCSDMRHWLKSEVDLLEQLATQVTIAIQQAQLYKQVQTLNSNLERQVEERTLQLQEKMREVQDLYEMKNIFLQAVSHDLRTSIMGLLMILKNLHHRSGDSVSISHSILDRIIESSNRQLTLINALSEDHFSQQRQIVLNCQRLSVREIVEDIVEDFESLFRQNQATLKNLIPDNLPATAADPAQLRCVFENLLTNALKHNPPGINLTIEATIEKGMIRCTVTDNGMGMSQQQCEQLFKIYVRSLHNQRLTGIGLGSYQCRQIIQAHGGKIGVNSTPGIGSQFWFTLPVAKSLKVGRMRNITDIKGGV